MLSSHDDSGVYLLVFDIPSPLRVEIGSLGEVSLAAGRYAYVGSARRYLRARLARHCRSKKPLRWHIDYVSTIATPLGALVWPWRMGAECRLAAALGATDLGKLAVHRFGASDCRCPGHLFSLSSLGLGIIGAGLTSAFGAARPQVLTFASSSA